MSRNRRKSIRRMPRIIRNSGAKRTERKPFSSEAERCNQNSRIPQGAFAIILTSPIRIGETRRRAAATPVYEERSALYSRENRHSSGPAAQLAVPPAEPAGRASGFRQRNSSQWASGNGKDGAGGGFRASCGSRGCLVQG